MRRRRSLLSQLMVQPLRRRKLLIEAFWYLLWAKAALVVVPFRWLVPLFNRQLTSAHGPESVERKRLREEVRWAIERVAARLPGTTVCFPRAIAAQIMCRRRGIGAVLYYGAAPLPGKGLSAHVWVLDESEGVVGHQVANSYQVMARFPS
jgi:hypothetical protein